MSVLRAAWGPLFEYRHQGLSRMMAYSVLLHVFLFLFMVVNQVFFTPQMPSFQGFQVNLIASEQGLSGLGGRGSTLKEDRRSKVKFRPSPQKSKSTKTLTPLTKPTTTKATNPPPLTRAPRTSVKAISAEKDDPERLQEWWKKQKKALSVPKPKSIITPKRNPVKKTRTARIDIQQLSPVNRPSSESITEPPQAVQNLKDPDDLEKSSSESEPGEGAGVSTNTSNSENGLGAMQARVSPGIKGVGGSGGGTSFFFPNYLQKVDQKIRWQWAPPPVALSGDKLVIRFVVKKDGSIDKSSVSIDKSSGNHFFDQSAMRAVYAAHPLPPLPKAYGGGILTVYMNFVVTEDM